MSTDIETAFHTSLDRLLRGEASLDACVAAYPEHEERLRDMLVVALDLQALAPLPLDRQAVDRGARLIDDELQRLRARIDQQPQPASAWERLAWWLPRFMPVRMAGLAAAFAIALVAYGGVTLAAVNSGPDSALYGYRLTLEELRIGLAPDEEKAYLYLDTAEQRLREIESAAGVGDSVAVARASTAYREVVRKGVDVLGAVARDTQPGAERTEDVAADYRRRLAEHDTRFDSLTTNTAEAQRAPISRAHSQVQAGLQDVHSGPILAVAPTATPDPIPALAAATPAPVPSPNPTPAALPTPTVSPTPTAPAATPTTAPTPQATPNPTPTAPAVPAIDVIGTAVVITGELLAVTDENLVVAGIPIARGEAAAVDAVPLTSRVRAEATVDADGSLKLVGLSAIEPAAAVSETAADSQPTAAPEPSPSPEPTQPPEATATATPAGGEPTTTPEASPTPEPTASDSTPVPDASPTPTAAEGEPTATPDATPTQATTPGEGEPTPDATPTPTVAEGEPTATPEATPPAEPSPTEAPEAPADVSPTPTVADGTPSPTPEATPSPDTPPADATPPPTPAEAAPTVTPEATPSPQPTPVETAPPADATPPPEVSPTPTPVTTETPPPPADAEPPSVPSPPTLQGILVSIDSFSVRAGGIVFSRPLDTPLVLHGPMAPGEIVVVTFEALRAASSYVLVAREVAPLNPPDGPVVTRWQGFVDERAEDALTLNGVRVLVPPEAREDDVWANLEAGALVEIELGDGTVGEPVAAALRVLGSSAAQSFSNLAGPPLG